MLCYEGEIRRARRHNRLPHEADAVYQEIVVKLQQCIRETDFQRKERVEKEFRELEMGTMPHGRFRILWEDKLDDFIEANLQMPNSEKLYRRHLAKLPYELKAAVTSQVWTLDGDGSQARKCRTWQDIAEAVEMELQTRVDVAAIGGSTRMVAPRTQLVASPGTYDDAVASMQAQAGTEPSSADGLHGQSANDPHEEEVPPPPQPIVAPRAANARRRRGVTPSPAEAVLSVEADEASGVEGENWGWEDNEVEVQDESNFLEGESYVRGVFNFWANYMNEVDEAVRATATCNRCTMGPACRTLNPTYPTLCQNKHTKQDYLNFGSLRCRHGGRCQRLDASNS